MTDPLAEIERGPAVMEALAMCRSFADTLTFWESRPSDVTFMKMAIIDRAGLQISLMRLGLLMLGGPVNDR